MVYRRLVAWRVQAVRVRARQSSVLRRLDCVLADIKQAVLAEFAAK